MVAAPDGSKKALILRARGGHGMNIVVDSGMPCVELRQQLYAGNLVMLTRLRALRDFVDYIREELATLFRPYDPECVHEHIDPPTMARILSAWKPQFIHSERSRKLVRASIRRSGRAESRDGKAVCRPTVTWAKSPLRASRRWHTVTTSIGFFAHVS
jgi:hypothetical protein